MASSELRELLLKALAGELPEERDDNVRPLSNAELKQALLDSIAETGAHTRNHTPTENVPKSVDEQNREWLENQNQMSMRPAGSNPMALNSDFSHLNRTINL